MGYGKVLIECVPRFRWLPWAWCAVPSWTTNSTLDRKGSHSCSETSSMRNTVDSRTPPYLYTHTWSCQTVVGSTVEHFWQCYDD